ncbi:MAG TPA: hypothetical protein DCR46_01460 [Cytophagales bacterium]|nr:hypothetical protein [Cytophagales bacterium]
MRFPTSCNAYNLFYIKIVKKYGAVTIIGKVHLKNKIDTSMYLSNLKPTHFICFTKSKIM